ncbi:MAG TPA: hypothetical protein PK025_08350 [Spirochaetales bacterium]|nr:hypothetical protein [Spirochaetales bacterium]HPD81044.1 hypothetical protein [Spirochaetales bacterium]
MKKFLVVVYVIVLYQLFAQSAVFLDEILSSKQITFSQAAYLVFVGNGEYQDTVQQKVALEEALKRKWIKQTGNPDNPITVAQFAYLVMRAFGINGGLMYTLFPGPRYGFRELVYKGLIPRTIDPQAYVDGALALRIIRIAAELKGLDK